MKLMFPLVGVIVAAGACCCCGGGDMDEMMEQIQQEAGSGASSSSSSSSDDVSSGASASSGSTASVGGASEGTCGRFKDDGFQVPSGLSIMTCATMGGTESIVMQGSGSPKDVCAPIKTWASDKGWSVTTEASMMDTVSIIMKNADKQLTIACTSATGPTTVSMSISQGY